MLGQLGGGVGGVGAGGIGGSSFASLDFTNALPTLNFNIDYAPPALDELKPENEGELFCVRLRVYVRWDGMFGGLATSAGMRYGCGLFG